MLNADSLSIRIKDVQIVHDLSFEVQPGTFVGILGPNGSGKTTLLRAISGVLPFDGSLTFKNQPYSSWSHRQLASHIAVVQQNQRIQFDFTVLDFVLLGSLPHKGWLEQTSSKDREQVEKLLTELNLLPLKNRLVTTLSGGESQRVFLAQALTQKPELLLLDEPTANLDIFYQLDLLNQIREQVDNGLTVLAVFHDIELATKYADSLLILKEGKQIAFGPSEDVVTADLLRTVYRVESKIHRSSNNQIQIQYLNTL